MILYFRLFNLKGLRSGNHGERVHLHYQNRCVSIFNEESSMHFTHQTSICLSFSHLCHIVNVKRGTHALMMTALITLVFVRERKCVRVFGEGDESMFVCVPANKGRY